MVRHVLNKEPENYEQHNNSNKTTTINNCLMFRSARAHITHTQPSTSAPYLFIICTIFICLYIHGHALARKRGRKQAKASAAIHTRGNGRTRNVNIF